MRFLLAGWLVLLCAAAGAAPSAEILKGLVTEVADGDGFTYFQVATPTERVWVYGPKGDIRLRDVVTVPTADRKREVRSKDLDHAFRDIYYVSDVNAVVSQQDRPPRAESDTLAGAEASVPGADAAGTAEGAAALPPGHPAVRAGAKAAPGVLPKGHPQTGGLPPGHPPVGLSDSPKATADSAEAISVPKAEGGLTVAEVYARKADLAGKEVAVRGRVVKANRQIMDRNWLHVRDGTGTSGTNDLTVTTDQEVPAVGTTVLVRGTLGVAKDFGYGYTYEVILETATVKPEP